MATFSGKRILITGASTGIGFEMAKALAAEGAHLALLARNMEKLNAARDAIFAKGDTPVHLHSCDVRDAQSLAAAIALAKDQLGGLDGVIANSGLCLPGRFHEMNLDDVETQIDTNLKGVYFTCHAAMPHLLESTTQSGMRVPRMGNKNHGRDAHATPFIAITSSPAGFLPIVGFSAYGITKAGLNMLADTLRLEYTKHGLSVHLLLPPDTDTPGYQNEITLYPPETRAVLSGGAVLDAEPVARAFLQGIARAQHQICPTWDARLMMRLHRVSKHVWTMYTRNRIK